MTSVAHFYRGGVGRAAVAFERWAPAPPLADYEAFFSSQPACGRSTQSVGPSQYRRIVILKRAGRNFAEIGRALGFTRDGIRGAYERLPEALR